MLLAPWGPSSCRSLCCRTVRNLGRGSFHNTWGQRLREVFEGIADPVWDGSVAEHPLAPSARHAPTGKISKPEDRIV